MKRFQYQAAVILVMMLLLLPMGALAAKLTDVWVTGVMQNEEASDKLPIGAIHWWYSNKDKAYYLFLPAGAKAEELRIWFEGAQSITTDGKTLSSGDPASFLTPGAKATLTCDKSKYTLVVMQSKNIPALFITTESGSLTSIHKSKNNQETGKMVMLNSDGTLSYDGALTQFKCRGNSSFTYAKKPYQFKLEKSTDLAGMGKAKTWILLADHEDNSLLRNKITFALADAVGLDYSSQSQTVDVFLNNDYYGTYLLCEKVEIGGSRIDINNLEKDTGEVNENPLNSYPAFGHKGYSLGQARGFQIPNDPEDITGGYLLELEKINRYKNEANGFTTTRGQPVVIKEPEAASQAQAAYISAFMQGFENAIFAEDGIDPASGKHYSEFVDMDSLVKKYLIEEISKNFDGNRSSLFFYKPSDEQSLLAFAGPVWDYDNAYGNYSSQRAESLKLPEYFAINKDNGERYYWYPALYKQPDFYQAVVKIYHEEFVPALRVLLGLEESEDGKLRSIDDFAVEIAPSAALNYTRWPVFNAKGRDVMTGRNYEENNAYLKKFLEGRLAFLSENWIE